MIDGCQRRVVGLPAIRTPRLGSSGLSISSDADQPVLLLSTARRYFVLVTVVVASGAYNAATFTATAILPQMQGAMAATQDEISSTVTLNSLATAVRTPMTGWRVGRFGPGG